MMSHVEANLKEKVSQKCNHFIKTFWLRHSSTVYKGSSTSHSMNIFSSFILSNFISINVLSFHSTQVHTKKEPVSGEGVQGLDGQNANRINIPLFLSTLPIQNSWGKCTEVFTLSLIEV